MASDIGSQTVTIRFHRPVDSDVVNKRFKDTRMLGIYKGGRMSWTGGSVTLTPLVCEISDGTHQVRVETTSNVTLALPSGRYLVLRWAYTGVVDTDFMEIISTVVPETNDIVVGKVVGSTPNYAERTTPDTHHLLLRVEEMEEPSTSVRVRAGIGHAGSAHNAISDQHLDLTAYSGNTVYIYVDDSGGVNASDEAVDYVGKALLAKIACPASPGVITNSIIEDVRSFVTPPAIPDGNSMTRDSNGKLEVKNDGVTLAKIASDLYANSLGVLGYQKLVGGLILMWGVQPGVYHTTYTISLPIALPNALVHASGAATSAEGTQNALMTHTYTKTSFKLWSGDNGPYHWFAIGY